MNYESKTNIIDYFRNRKNRKKHFRNTDNTVKLHQISILMIYTDNNDNVFPLLSGSVWGF